MVDAPPAGYARVEAFLTAKDDVAYAIVPRRPVGDIVIDDVQAPAGVRVTMIEGGQAVDASVEGGKLRIRVPAALSAALPERTAYTFKMAGVR
jgi:alpha-L-fucosidase